MAQLINFDNYKPADTKRKGISVSPSTTDFCIQVSDLEVDHLYKLTLNLLAQNNPNKLTFSINETAEALGVGPEFIRRRIKSGKIKAIYFGDKPFINIVELARISIEGV